MPKTTLKGHLNLITFFLSVILDLSEISNLFHNLILVRSLVMTDETTLAVLIPITLSA
jgi:hypothetical protein